LGNLPEKAAQERLATPVLISFGTGLSRYLIPSFLICYFPSFFPWIDPEEAKLLRQMFTDSNSPFKRLGDQLQNPNGEPFNIAVDFLNPAFRKVEIASVSGFSTAHSLAKITSSILSNRLLSKEGLLRAISNPTLQFDFILRKSTNFSNCGWADVQNFKLGDSFWGWGGYGGSAVVFSQKYEIGFSYVMNGLQTYSLAGFEVAGSLLNTVTQCVNELESNKFDV